MTHPVESPRWIPCLFILRSTATMHAWQNRRNEVVSSVRNAAVRNQRSRAHGIGGTHSRTSRFLRPFAGGFVSTAGRSSRRLRKRSIDSRLIWRPCRTSGSPGAAIQFDDCTRVTNLRSVWSQDQAAVVTQVETRNQAAVAGNHPTSTTRNRASVDGLLNASRRLRWGIA